MNHDLKVNKLLVKVFSKKNKKYSLDKNDKIGVEYIQPIRDLYKVEFKSKDCKFDSSLPLSNKISYFLSVMNNSLPEENKKNLYSNIEWLDIQMINGADNVKFHISKICGEYEILENRIKLLDKDDVGTLYHELMHLSSNNYKSKSGSAGLRYCFEENIIGDAINEGYTDLLVERYFNIIDDSYGYEKNICKCLDFIIGQEKMEEFYFNCDLFGLVEELKKYYNISEIQEFLTGTDIISNYIGKYIFKASTGKAIDLIANNITEFLIKGISLKARKLSYDIDKFKKEFNEYFKLIKFESCFDSNVNCYDEDRIKEIVSINFGYDIFDEKNKKI